MPMIVRPLLESKIGRVMMDCPRFTVTRCGLHPIAHALHEQLGQSDFEFVGLEECDILRRGHANRHHMFVQICLQFRPIGGARHFAVCVDQFVHDDDVLFEGVCLLTPRLSWFYASNQALLHSITCSMDRWFNGSLVVIESWFTLVQWVWGSRVHCDKCALGHLHRHSRKVIEFLLKTTTSVERRICHSRPQMIH